MQRRAEQIAGNLLKIGLPIEEIALATGLAESQIRKLKKKKASGSQKSKK